MPIPIPRALDGAMDERNRYVDVGQVMLDQIFGDSIFNILSN